MFDNVKLLLRLFWRPVSAMSAILDEGSLLFATAAVLAVSLLLQFNVKPILPQAPAVGQASQPFHSQPDDEPPVPHYSPQPWLSFSFYTPLLLLAAIYVPGALLITMLLGSLGAFWTVFERDYSPLLTCASMAWAAVNLPLAIVARVAPLPALAAVAALAYLDFAVLMFFAIRTVFGVENGIAAATVALSWIPLVAAVAFWAPLSGIVGLLASPFFLFYAYRYLGSDFTNL